jgi:hypothetical protein
VATRVEQVVELLPLFGATISALAPRQPHRPTDRKREAHSRHALPRRHDHHRACVGATCETEIVVWRGSLAPMEPLSACPSGSRQVPAPEAVFTTVASG